MIRQKREQALGAELVRDFVQKAHSDLEGVQALFDQEPRLLNAAHDWGGGDWETALGSAGHMGRRDIALFLTGKGARIDLFVATMMGHLDVVRSILETYPEMRTSLGPHGISLEAHAKAGGKNSVAVLEYLKGK